MKVDALEKKVLTMFQLHHSIYFFLNKVKNFLSHWSNQNSLNFGINRIDVLLVLRSFLYTLAGWNEEFWSDWLFYTILNWAPQITEKSSWKSGRWSPQKKKLFDKLKPLEQQVLGIVKLRSQMRKDKNV